MARFGKMPLVKECDFVKIVSTIDSIDEDYLDWYLGSDEVQNRTGGWYFGVTYIGKRRCLKNVGLIYSK